MFYVLYVLRVINSSFNNDQYMFPTPIYVEKYTSIDATVTCSMQ